MAAVTVSRRRAGRYALGFTGSRARSDTLRIGRYGLRSGCGRGGAPVTDRGVARLRRAAYVSGIVHRWDLRRPGLPGPGRSRRCPDGRHLPLRFLVPVQPTFTDAERLALAGLLAGYRGLTREAYTLDLRQFTSWCRTRSLPLFSVRRAGIETFARELEALGGPRNRDPAAVHHRRVLQVRRRGRAPRSLPGRARPPPRLDYESHATALDRNELGALLVAAGLGAPSTR